MGDEFKHNQEIFLNQADSFLVQYFLCAHNKLIEYMILPRLFAMGHSLELYVKAGLMSPEGIFPKGHDIPSLIKIFDNSLSLTKEEVDAGKCFFNRESKNFDLGIYEKYGQAMELYQAQYFLADLKYYIAQDNKLIYPIKISLDPINYRYLSIVKKIRTNIKSKNKYHDEKLVKALEAIGFPVNLSDFVI